jgi:hypothetical protein
MRSTASEEEEPSQTSSRAAAAAATTNSHSSAADYAFTVQVIPTEVRRILARRRKSGFF